MSSLPPDKQFFKIGDVAEIVGVKAHVLRYWESEFAALRPLKTRGAHRMYRRADLELACLIRRLVHDEGFTLSGAKKRIRELRGEPEPELVEARHGASREASLRAELVQLRGELADLLIELNRPAEAQRPQDEGEGQQVVVTAVVQKTALLTRRSAR